VSRQTGRSPILHAGAEAHHQLMAGYPPDHERLSGCAEVLAGVGISINDVPIVEINSNEGVAEGAALLLDSAPDATAVLALAGDPQAIGVLDEARRRNINVPRDLSVVGFDDTPEAARADPPLTTIVQPTVEKGRVAARILFEAGPPRQVVLPVQLIVRSSTASPRV
jgi:DNA-binding LacI/PurR family transcriptional regulator